MKPNDLRDFGWIEDGFTPPAPPPAGGLAASEVQDLAPAPAGDESVPAENFSEQSPTSPGVDVPPWVERWDELDVATRRQMVRGLEGDVLQNRAAVEVALGNSVMGGLERLQSLRDGELARMGELLGVVVGKVKAGLGVDSGDARKDADRGLRLLSSLEKTMRLHLENVAKTGIGVADVLGRAGVYGPRSLSTKPSVQVNVASGGVSAGVEAADTRTAYERAMAGRVVEGGK